METKVLVAYGTKYGATAEIAEKIGKVLRDAGLAADVLRADRAGDLSAYDAVVVGSAVYIGRWRKEVVNFVKDNEQALAAKPVWIFSSGPTGEGDPVEMVQGWRLPGSVEPIVDRIQPRDIAVFHGAADEAKMGRLDKWLLKNVKAPTGDFRDWDAIEAWAADIAGALGESDDG
jgi:menaquinone-dependent protoporphyrinogen oxidase